MEQNDDGLIETDRPGAEWDRLTDSPIPRTEYFITQHCIQTNLPASGRILDAGSGPGRYAIPLARQGYEMVLLDTDFGMLRLARAKCQSLPVRYSTGDIRDLPFPTSSFDAVINLGAPLTYLTEAEQRRQAMTEMARVLKPGGVLLTTAVTRVSLYRGMVYWMNPDLIEQCLSGQVTETGIFDGFTHGYAFLPGELAGLVRAAGLTVLDEVGCEGLASYLPPDHLQQVENDPRLWAFWKKILLETCNEPSLIGFSSHHLIVGKKSENSSFI